jgi:hemerythrin-like metal-binding protein
MQWTMSHAVFVEEIDDDHKEIFECLSDLRSALAKRKPAEISKSTRRLVDAIDGHFAHEERLMRARRTICFAALAQAVARPRP